MDLRKLRYFAQVVEARSMSRAAVQLRVAQPALSKSIHALEEDLGVGLLQRSAQGVIATEAGNRLYEHCQIIFRDVDRARLEVLKSGDAPRTRISVGMPLSVATVLALPLIAALEGAVPGARLELMQAHSHQLGADLRSGRLDLALMAKPRSHEGLSLRPVATEELYFVGRKSFNDHPDEVSFQEAADHAYILPAVGNGLRTAAESYFRSRSLQLNVAHEIDAVSLIPRCVDAGLGASLLPGGFVQRDAAFDRLAVRAFAGGCSRSIVLCHATKALSAAAEQAASLVERLCTQMIVKEEWLGARHP